MKHHFSDCRAVIMSVVFALVAWSAATVAAQTVVPAANPTAEGSAATDKPAGTDASTRPSKPDQWYDKGILFTVYGNDRAAVEAFKKVIKATPNRSDAHFQLGVSYGEIGNYPLALRAINQAISLNPDKSVYYYGRARIYLLSGDTAAAMSDFYQAADMGHRDAISYLSRIEGDS